MLHYQQKTLTVSQVQCVVSLYLHSVSEMGGGVPLPKVQPEV